MHTESHAVSLSVCLCYNVHPFVLAQVTSPFTVLFQCGTEYSDDGSDVQWLIQTEGTKPVEEVCIWLPVLGRFVCCCCCCCLRGAGANKLYSLC